MRCGVCGSKNSYGNCCPFGGRTKSKNRKVPTPPSLESSYESPVWAEVDNSSTGLATAGLITAAGDSTVTYVFPALYSSTSGGTGNPCWDIDTYSPPKEEDLVEAQRQAAVDLCIWYHNFLESICISSTISGDRENPSVKIGDPLQMMRGLQSYFINEQQRLEGAYREADRLQRLRRQEREEHVVTLNSYEIRAAELTAKIKKLEDENKILKAKHSFASIICDTSIGEHSRVIED